MVLSLVIPCFNERDSLAPLLQALARLRRDLPADLPLELVLVDDGSRDGTAEALRRQAPALAAVGRWQLLELSRNFGKEAALLAGLDHASGAAAVLLDADLQDPPELIPAMVVLWRDGHQVVNGVRRQRQGDGWAKRLTAHWFYRVFRATSHLDIRLDASDFRLIDREVIDAILGCRERVRFSKGFVAWAGFRQIDLPYDRPAREAGRSAFGLWKLWNYALDGLFSFSTAPLRIWTYLGGAVALLSVTYTVVIVLRALMGGIDVPGYASIVAILTFLGGMQMIGIGLVGEYVGRIYLEVKQRPHYVLRRRDQG